MPIGDTMPSCRRLAIAALALAPLASPVRQPLCPDGQPVRLIVGYAAGGPVDRAARLFAPLLGGNWASPVIVENKTGANATIAGSVVLRHADGLTLWYAASPPSPSAQRDEQRCRSTRPGTNPWRHP